MALDALRCNHLAPLGFKGLSDNELESPSPKHPTYVLLITPACWQGVAKICKIWLICSMWHVGVSNFESVTWKRKFSALEQDDINFVWGLEATNWRRLRTPRTTGYIC